MWVRCLAVIASVAFCASAGEFKFRHHFIERALPVSKQGNGDYGLTALADLDRDGDLDFVLGGRGVPPATLYWFEFQKPNAWVKHIVGTNYLSDVGLAALDVDRDGWTDLVCSGVWYRNTGKAGKPKQEQFERYVFDPNGAGAHDILIADINNDGRVDVVAMGDERTKLNALCWYSIPSDPKTHWTRHYIGPPVHGAITPNGIADLDGDGDLDILRANTWFEHKNGNEWTPHANIPMGRKGPFGVCVRTAVADLDADGTLEVVIADADITESKVAILKNTDKGQQWTKTELPQSFRYGSLHALGVADFNGDKRPDIAVCEQEELLPSGRQDPRFVIWENAGQGRFVEHVILDQKLGGHELQVGDVDADGDIDICSKPWSQRAWNGNDGKMHVDFLENLMR